MYLPIIDILFANFATVTQEIPGYQQTTIMLEDYLPNHNEKFQLLYNGMKGDGSYLYPLIHSGLKKAKLCNK